MSGSPTNASECPKPSASARPACAQTPGGMQSPETAGCHIHRVARKCSLTAHMAENKSWHVWLFNKRFRMPETQRQRASGVCPNPRRHAIARNGGVPYPSGRPKVLVDSAYGQQQEFACLALQQTLSNGQNRSPTCVRRVPKPQEACNRQKRRGAISIGSPENAR